MKEFNKKKKKTYLYIFLLISVFILFPIIFRYSLVSLFKISSSNWIDYAGSIISAFIGGIVIIITNKSERELQWSYMEKQKRDKHRNTINISVYREQPFFPSQTTQIGSYEKLYLTDNFIKYFYPLYYYDREKVLNDIQNFKIEDFDYDKKKHTAILQIKDSLYAMYYISKNRNIEIIEINKESFKKTVFFSENPSFFKKKLKDEEKVFPKKITYLMLENFGESLYLKNVYIDIIGTDWFGQNTSRYSEHIEMFTWGVTEKIIIPLISKNNGEILVTNLKVKYTSSVGENNEIVFRNAYNNFENKFEIDDFKNDIEQFEVCSINNKLISSETIKTLSENIDSTTTPQ